jgi:hypothetical protein
LQLVRDLIIGSLGITDLRGLENLASFGNELSIINNDQLVTLRHLGENLPPEYRTSIRNLGIRDNPLLRDFDGLSYIQNVEGMQVMNIELGTK